jgi:hypothetical protein
MNYWVVFIHIVLSYCTANPSQQQVQSKSPDPLPSIRLGASEELIAKKKRKFYGGTGDKLHLGGFIEYDGMGVSNNTWNFMMV